MPLSYLLVQNLWFLAVFPFRDTSVCSQPASSHGSLPWCLLLLLSHQVVSDSAISWTAVGQASLSLTFSQHLPKFMSITLVMPSSHLIFCRPLLLLPSALPSIKVFSSEWAVHIKWPEQTICVQMSTFYKTKNTSCIGLGCSL